VASVDLGFIVTGEDPNYVLERTTPGDRGRRTARPASPEEFRMFRLLQAMWKNTERLESELGLDRDIQRGMEAQLERLRGRVAVALTFAHEMGEYALPERAAALDEKMANLAGAVE
jgi:hypothetical protein